MNCIVWFRAADSFKFGAWLKDILTEKEKVVKSIGWLNEFAFYYLEWALLNSFNSETRPTIIRKMTLLGCLMHLLCTSIIFLFISFFSLPSNGKKEKENPKKNLSFRLDNCNDNRIYIFVPTKGQLQ